MLSPYEGQVIRALDCARQQNLRADLRIEAWEVTIDDFQKKCAYCDKPFEALDHFISLASGGPSCIGNCLPCCYTCNNAKDAE